MKNRGVRIFFAGMIAAVAGILASSCTTLKFELQPAHALPEIASQKTGISAQSITVPMPTDSRTNRMTYSETANRPGFMIGNPQHYVPSGDPLVWIRDGLSEGLRKSGYQVQTLDTPVAPQTAVVVSIDLRELNCVVGYYSNPSFEEELEREWKRQGHQSPWNGPAVKLTIGVRITASGGVLSDTTIEAVSPEHPWVPYDPFWPFHSDMKRPSFDCSSTDDLSTMSREALEAFVAKAVPSIAQTLQTAKLQPPLKN